MEDTAASPQQQPEEDLDTPDDRHVDLAARAPDSQRWRQRAKDYNSTYKGPVHWVHLLNVLSATGSVPLACREVGISPGLFNRRRERYPEFATHVLAAVQFFREGVLEKAALSRAVDGWLEPVFYKGERVGFVRKYSDTLLNKMLEANMPEKYRSKSDNTPGSGTIRIVGGLPSEEEMARQEREADVGVGPAAPPPA